MITLRLTPVICLFSCVIAGARAPAASNDNDVEWFGVYSGSESKSPERPEPGEDFRLELRVYRGDITAARVRTWDGDEDFVDMAWDRNEGAEFDVGSATVPGRNDGALYYHFEIRDGSDVDYYNSLGMWGSEPSRGDFRVDYSPLGSYPLGATPTDDGVVFRVWAPNAETAAVVGQFNNWSSTNAPMERVSGVWEARVLSARVGQQYKFVFDGDIWRTDPRARRQVNSVGNSIVYDKDLYEWGDDDWVTPYFEDMIIYELHVGSFSGEGDGVSASPARFRDAIDAHIDDLVELGINMVELMPVCEFAAERSWGYNPSFLFAIEEAYGGPDGLKYFVDHLHRRGIGVLIDVVYNHLGGTDLAGNLLDYDGEEIYFYPEGNGFRDTPWGPRPDYGRREVREYIRDNIRFWLEEYHVDGFRLDGTAFVNVNAEGWQLLKEIAEVTDTVSRKAIVIAEHLPNDPAVTRPLAVGGAGIDSQWNDALHDNLREAIHQAAFGDPNMASVAAGMNHFDLGTGTQVVNYIESHDEAAVHGRISVAADGNNPRSEYAIGRSKVALAIVVLSAGIPMLLQGQELLESRNFGDAPEHRIRWSYADTNDGFLGFSRELLALRSRLPSFRSDGQQNVYHVNDGANVLAWHRYTNDGHDAVIVVSLSNDDFTDYELGFPQGGVWYDVLNGSRDEFDGPGGSGRSTIDAGGPGRHGLPHSATIRVPRMAVRVFTQSPPPSEETGGFLRGDCNGDGSMDLSDPVDGLAQLFLGGGPPDCESACDANADGNRDISDAVYSLSYLFLGGAPPPRPWPDCDVDPSCDRDCP